LQAGWNLPAQRPYQGNARVGACRSGVILRRRGDAANMTRKESAMPDKVNNLQDMFLNSLRRSKTPVTMFLVKGVKLQGIITWFDNFSVLLRRDGQAQLIYKHAISTIMPSQPLDLGGLQAAFAEQLEKKKPTLLQEVFLTAVKRSGEHVTMFLVNGVMLQGEIGAFDLFCMLLERDGLCQLVYKHAISTVQPENPVNFQEAQAEE
jgi:host factor-I protein